MREAGAAFLSSRFMWGLPWPPGWLFASLWGSVHPPGTCPWGRGAPGALCSRGGGRRGGWTQESLHSPRHWSPDLLLRAEAQGHLSPGTATGTRWGTKVARTLTSDPAEGPLCPPSGPAPAGSADAATVTPQCLVSPPRLEARPVGPSPPFWGEAQAPWGGSETTGRRPGTTPG